MAIEPIGTDELDRMRGGLQVRGRKISFGIHAVERRDGRLVATYRYQAAAAMAQAQQRQALPGPSAPAGASPRSAGMSASSNGQAQVRMQSLEAPSPAAEGGDGSGRFALRPQVVVRGALRRPDQPQVNYLTTGQGGLKRPVTEQQIGRFRVITGGARPREQESRS
jgi:hypothetical protein